MRIKRIIKGVAAFSVIFAVFFILYDFKTKFDAAPEADEQPPAVTQKAMKTSVPEIPQKIAITPDEKLIEEYWGHLFSNDIKRYAAAYQMMSSASKKQIAEQDFIHFYNIAQANYKRKEKLDTQVKVVFENSSFYVEREDLTTVLQYIEPEIAYSTQQLERDSIYYGYSTYSNPTQNANSNLNYNLYYPPANNQYNNNQTVQQKQNPFALFSEEFFKIEP